MKKHQNDREKNEKKSLKNTFFPQQEKIKKKHPIFLKNVKHSNHRENNSNNLKIPKNQKILKKT